MSRTSTASSWVQSAALAVAVTVMAPGLALADTAAEKPQDPPMQPVSLGRLASILEEQDKNVVVADLWASWCISCIERFPKMVEMSHRYASQGVRFMTLNLDDPQDQSGIDWANDFLNRMGGEFAHFHLDENLSRSFEALDLKSLPVVLVYDDQGTERFRLTNDNPNTQFSEDDVERAIRQLLSR